MRPQSHQPQSHQPQTHQPPAHAYCVDRLVTPLPPPGLPNSDALRLAALRSKLWPPNQRVLHVRFLDGDPRLHAKIATYAVEWCRHGAIELIFDNAPDAPIRVSLTPGASWSLLGTDALHPSIALDQPTMNLGWLTTAMPNDEFAAVVMHEFGHALGLIHEHQSPAADIPWDREAVYAYYSGPPNFWTCEEIDRNIFARYAVTETNFSEFDPHSIMGYPIPCEFTIGGFSTGFNRSLSDMDRTHFARLYPFAAP